MSDLTELLEHGELIVDGQLVAASNATLLCRVTHGEAQARCIYKPTAGERPLWDFPDGTLAAREVAAYLVSEAAGWHVVPATLLRDGPFGPGMCQVWVDDSNEDLVDVVGPDSVPNGWLTVLEAVDGDGKPVALVHADDVRLRRMALFDVVINNADRKGGHVLTDAAGAVLGVDHGVSFHVEDKLRTVLWGWSASSLQATERELLARLHRQLTGELGTQLKVLLSELEIAATVERVAHLLTAGQLPGPGGRRRPIPWPPL